MNYFSFLAGIVVFSSLGYLSIQVNKNIEDVVDSGMGLSFIAYPELLSTLKFPSLFSFMFFLLQRALRPLSPSTSHSQDHQDPSRSLYIEVVVEQLVEFDCCWCVCALQCRALV